MIRQLLIILFIGLCFTVHSYAQFDSSISASDTLQNDTALFSSDSLNDYSDSIDINNTTVIDKPPILSDPDTTETAFIELEPRQVRQKTWIFMLFVLILMLIGFTRSINLKKHYNLMKESFNIRTSGVGLDNHISEITIQNILYLFLQCLVIAYLFFTLFNYEELISFHSGFQAFLFTLILIISVYVIKFFVYRIITVILDIKEMMPVLFSVQTSIGYLFALAAFPVMVLAYYIKSENGVALLYNILGVIGIVYVLYRFVKVSLLLSQPVRIPWIYLFLYLCTLEIIPLLVMANWLGFGWI